MSKISRPSVVSMIDTRLRFSRLLTRIDTAMLKYVAARVGVLIPLLFGLSILVFLYIHVIPGNPVAGMLGPAGTPSLIAQLSRQFGLDQPLPVQYWHWLDGIFHGEPWDLFHLTRGDRTDPGQSQRQPASS